MLFNSLEFIIFLPIVFYLYWFIFSKKILFQNLVLLISSYIFYSWWDWRFLSLLFSSTIMDYFVGQRIHSCKKKKLKKFYLLLSIFFNLTLLGFFKYFNFFIQSWIELLAIFGFEYQNPWTLNIILPVGISFYTFQTMSYTLDIYYGKLKPTKDFISFASFVSFFPQLVAGPIERASNFLPQILKCRKFNYKQGVQGLRLILWGMFKKIVIADSLAWRVDYVFNNYHDYNGGVLLLGLIYFSFQIYCDFSGYSDIAIGISKLFGFELKSNFKFPYFSRNIKEFWRRWHISLSTWFRDYLYVPLGGSIHGQWIAFRNILLIFTISGFWHGANWAFISWGLVHAMLYIPFFIFKKNYQYISSTVAEHSCLPTIREVLQMVFTFLLITITWVFFRSQNIESAFEYLFNMITKFGLPTKNRSGIIFVLLILLLDWIIRKDERNPIQIKNSILRWIAYLILFFSIIYSINTDNSKFIYFQF